MISVEWCIWFAGTFALAAAVASGVVDPLVHNARAQAALNAEGVAVVERALAVCQPSAAP